MRLIILLTFLFSSFLAAEVYECKAQPNPKGFNDTIASLKEGIRADRKIGHLSYNYKTTLINYLNSMRDFCLESFETIELITYTDGTAKVTALKHCLDPNNLYKSEFWKMSQSQIRDKVDGYTGSIYSGSFPISNEELSKFKFRDSKVTFSKFNTIHEIINGAKGNVSQTFIRPFYDTERYEFKEFTLEQLNQGQRYLKNTYKSHKKFDLDFFLDERRSVMTTLIGFKRIMNDFYFDEDSMRLVRPSITPLKLQARVSMRHKIEEMAITLRNYDCKVK
jgi:hypothetical protein